MLNNIFIIEWAISVVGMSSPLHPAEVLPNV